MARTSVPFLRIALVSAVMTVALVLAAIAAEPKKPAPQTEAKPDSAQAAMMAEMMKSAAPGPAHEKLKAMEGQWKTVSKMWLTPGEPTITEGTSENRMILGGRYLEQRYKGTFMGQPFEGYGLVGYDNRKGVYTMVWVDNSSTEMSTGEGSMDDTTHELVFKTVSAGPDGLPVELKTVTRIVDPNRHVFSSYSVTGGKEQLTMEITYTRM